MNLLYRFSLVIIISILACACGGNSAPVPGQPAPQDQTADLPQLQEVRMRPMEPQNPPFSDQEFAKAVSSPQSLAAQLQPLRQVRFLEADLVRMGGSFDPTLPLSNVAVSGAGDSQATFSPMWTGPGDQLGDAAYALYRFPLQDFGASAMEQTLGWSWTDIRPAEGNFWVGFGDIASNSWKWFEGEPDGVLTIGSYTPFEAPDGTVLCALVVLGETTVVLDGLEIGAFELRGTGEDEVEFSPPAPLFPEFPLMVDLTVDLSPGCAPIGDQGSTWMCTAFATANGALNYELNALYGSCGWDLEKPFNRASPRFVYNQTGIDLGGSCPVGGRGTSSVGTWLLTNGAATEFNAPIGAVSPSASYNCTANWSAPALTDADLLHPTLKAFYGSKHPVTDNWRLTDANINSLRYVLRVVRKPFVFRTDLDSNFSAVDYENGGSWTYSGPRTGGHAMLIVGYDDDRNGGSFKVRNSWGVNWGDDGYCWITYDSMKSSTAGVYAYYIVCSYDQDVEERFCPSPPPFLPPFDIVFEPIPGPIVFSFAAIPGVQRFKVFRDGTEEPYAFISQKNEEDPLVFEDLQVDDFFTHVYWIQAVSGDEESPLSRPFFCWREPSIPPM